MNRIIYVDPDTNATMLVRVEKMESTDLVLYVVVARNACLNLYIEIAPYCLTILRIVMHLIEPDSQVHVKGFYLGLTDSAFSCVTHQLHAADRTQSSVLFKSLLADRSRLSYKGLINVDKGCNVVKAVQVNKNSLISPDARCISIPSLQVQSKNVSCTHASATGPFAKELVWYAQSRGISISSAYTLMIKAFLADVMLLDRLESVVQEYTSHIRLDTV